MPLGVPSQSTLLPRSSRLTNSRPCQFNACLRKRAASGESPSQYIYIIQLGRPSLTLSGHQVRHKMPPKAALTKGRPKGADAPMNQSREAHHPVRPLHSPEGANTAVTPGSHGLHARERCAGRRSCR